MGHDPSSRSGAKASSRGTVTDLLLAWSEGEAEALEQLMPRVYGELRRLARGYMRRERPGHALQTTALVHEAYLRLVEQDRVKWRNRAHFFAISAQAMRRILLDAARRAGSAKRGRGILEVALPQLGELAVERPSDLLALDDALRDLETVDAGLSRLIELRFFGGLSNEEAGAVLGLSVPTVTRRVRLARAWLYRYLTAGRRSEGSPAHGRRQE